MRKITVNFWSVNGRSRWVVSSWRDGKRVRAHFDSKAAAEDHAADLRQQVSNAGEIWLALPSAEKHGIMRAYQSAKDAGLDFEKIVADAIKAPTMTATPSHSLLAVVTELLQSKRASGLSERYCRAMGYLFKRFISGRETLSVANVSLADCEAFLNSLPALSRQTERARLATLFNYAIRRGYVTANPISRMEPYRITRPPPFVFSVEQVELCLGWFKDNPRAGAWFTLSCLAGLRPEEADRTEWSAIDWHEKLIRVEGQTSKTGQRRIVYPHGIVFEWLSLFRRLKSELPIDRHRRMDALLPLREKLGLAKWPQDGTRHTAASYLVTESSNLHEVAQALGHSEAMLRKHYLARVSKVDAERFWNLRP